MSKRKKDIAEIEIGRDEVNRRIFLKTGGITGMGILGDNTLLSLPPSTDAEEAERQQSLRVMSYNIKHGGANESYDLRRVAGQIWATDPDIVAIQEVDKELALPSIDDPRSDLDDQPELLADWLNMDVEFYPQLSLPPKDGYRNDYGDIILSKHPILESNQYTFNAHGPTERQKIAETRISVHGAHLWFYDLHLYWPEEATEVRKEQIKELLDVSTRREAPRVMAGDFNTRYESSNYELLNSEYVDVLRETGDDIPTFPASDPEIRIDYVFSTDDVDVKDGRVISINASDHLPIVADIAVPKGQNG